LGAWVWADESIEANAPILKDREIIFTHKIKISTEPAFFAYSGILPEGFSSGQVILSTPPFDQPVHVYYDSIVLVEGERPPNEIPVFDDERSLSGVWGGESFVNYVRNPAANLPWLRMRPSVEAALDNFFPDRPTYILASIADYQGSGWYYRTTGQFLFRTFWGLFGWSHVPLVGGARAYQILEWVTITGIIGAAVFTIRTRKRLPWTSLFLLGLALVFVWSSAWVRGISSITSSIFIPSARYTYPVFTASILLVSVGWLESLRIVGNWLRLPRILPFAIYILLLLCFTAIGLYSVVKYYHF
jgi:hypothetical protein